MIDSSRARTIQSLADAIAGAVDVLGSECTAALLGSVALDLLDDPGGRCNRHDRRPHDPKSQPTSAVPCTDSTWRRS